MKAKKRSFFVLDSEESEDIASASQRAQSSEQYQQPKPLSYSTQKNAEQKQLEVYGFVAWVASFFSLATFVVWSFCPEEILHSFGIYYYPDKRWALQIPAYLCACWMTLFLGTIFYYHKSVKPLYSATTFQDDPSVARVAHLYDNFQTSCQAGSPTTLITPNSASTSSPASPTSADSIAAEFRPEPCIPKAQDLPITFVNSILFPSPSQSVSAEYSQKRNGSNIQQLVNQLIEAGSNEHLGDEMTMKNVLRKRLQPKSSSSNHRRSFSTAF